jgi:hypothetical protein
MAANALSYRISRGVTQDRAVGQVFLNRIRYCDTARQSRRGRFGNSRGRWLAEDRL